MTDGTDQTPPVEDNLLGIASKEAINEAEAEGILRAELMILSVDEESDVSVTLLLAIHRVAFGRLYDWAGKWRRLNVTVGQLEPPAFHQVPMLMYQFVEELNYRFPLANTPEKLIDLLAWRHHRFVWIHPFTNGNGRTARLLTNLVLLLKRYAPIRLYHRAGDSRNLYVTALRAADRGDYTELQNLILREFRPL